MVAITKRGQQRSRDPYIAIPEDPRTRSEWKTKRSVRTFVGDEVGLGVGGAPTVPAAVKLGSLYCTTTGQPVQSDMHHHKPPTSQLGERYKPGPSWQDGLGPAPAIHLVSQPEYTE